MATPEFTMKVFDDFFKWNFKYVYEVWEDLLAKPLVGKKPMASLRVKYREIIRIIRKYHSLTFTVLVVTISLEKQRLTRLKRNNCWMNAVLQG